MLPFGQTNPARTRVPALLIALNPNSSGRFCLNKSNGRKSWAVNSCDRLSMNETEASNGRPKGDVGKEGSIWAQLLPKQF